MSDKKISLTVQELKLLISLCYDRTIINRYNDTRKERKELVDHFLNVFIEEEGEQNED